MAEEAALQSTALVDRRARLAPYFTRGGLLHLWAVAKDHKQRWQSIEAQTMIETTNYIVLLCAGVLLILFREAFATKAVKQQYAVTRIRWSERPFKIGAVLVGAAWIVLSLLSLTGVL